MSEITSRDTDVMGGAQLHAALMSFGVDAHARVLAARLVVANEQIRAAQ
jgi:hypothetical protein